MARARRPVIPGLPTGRVKEAGDYKRSERPFGGAPTEVQAGPHRPGGNVAVTCRGWTHGPTGRRHVRPTAAQICYGSRRPAAQAGFVASILWLGVVAGASIIGGNRRRPSSPPGRATVGGENIRCQSTPGQTLRLPDGPLFASEAVASATAATGLSCFTQADVDLLPKPNRRALSPSRRRIEARNDYARCCATRTGAPHDC
jgi:hypothetical protein